MNSYTWDGTNPGAYTDPSHWLPNGVPNATDVAFIGTGSVNASGLTISGVPNTAPRSTFTDPVILFGRVNIGSVNSSATLNLTPGADGIVAGTVLSLGAMFGSTVATNSNLNVTGLLNVFGEFNVDTDPQANLGPPASIPGYTLNITLSPTLSGGLGAIVIDNSDDKASIIGSRIAATAGNTYSTALVNNAVLKASDAVVDVPIYSQPGSTGMLLVQTGTLEVGSSVAAQTIVLQSGTTLIVDNPSEFNGQLAPTQYYLTPTASATFSSMNSQTVDFKGVVATGFTFEPNSGRSSTTVHLTGASGSISTFDLSPDVAAVGVALTSDGKGGTNASFNLPTVSQTGVQFANARGDYTVSQAANAEVVTGHGVTEYVTPNSSLYFTDGTLITSASSQEAALDRLYEGAFGRTIDGSGLTYFKDALSSNHGTLADIANGLLSSPEFTGKNPSNGDFVASLYENVLGRTADSGAEYWNGLLNQGVSRGAVLFAFNSTGEALQHDSTNIGSGLFIAKNNASS